jgi:hypothetical protein
LHEALTAGLMIRPDHCSRCHKKNPSGNVIHGHQEDYSKPLEVMWLCTSCHQLRHKLNDEKVSDIEWKYGVLIDKVVPTFQKVVSFFQSS